MKLFKHIEIFLVVIISFLCSCSKEEISNELIVKNELNIEVNGTQYKSINEKIGGNENCDKLFINASYFDKNKIDFTIKFEISKSGQLLKVWYEEYILPNNSIQVKKIFLSPNFRPLSTFAITNFSYNNLSGEVKFNFAGIVFLENNINTSKNIEGNIKIESLKSVTCSISKTGLTFESPNLNLYSFYNSRIQFSNLTQQHQFFSNNGYKIYVNTISDLWNYELGEIVFSENANINNVEFAKAIGPIFADQIQNINQQQWTVYQTSGKIILLSKTIENNEKVITGKLNLKITENNVTIYELNGIDFKTGSFEN